jgi:hypothetical protein
MKKKGRTTEKDRKDYGQELSLLNEKNKGGLQRTPRRQYDRA